MTDDPFAMTADHYTGEDQEQFLETPLMENLDEMTWWTTSNWCIGMGAERQFDYTMRGDLGRDLTPRMGLCYELALGAFTGWEKMLAHMPPIQRDYIKPMIPAPVALVHGKIVVTPDIINHAWVILEDGRMWEPVTGLICDPVLFMAGTGAVVERSYDETEARIMMLRNQNYGPWHG